MLQKRPTLLQRLYDAMRYGPSNLTFIFSMAAYLKKRKKHIAAIYITDFIIVASC